MDITKLKAQLTKHEGVKLSPYQDTAGKTTIGYGHNLSNKPISLGAALYILEDDIQDTITFLQQHCPWWVGLDDVRRRAIADLAFNLMGKLLDFHNMIAAIQAKDWPRASAELLSSKFAAQTGQRAHDLASQLLTGKD